MAEKTNLRGGAPTTIKDISAQLNVSSVSVHRALSGKDGVGEDLRKRILATAKEMGYEVNYAASSLKRGPCRVAAVIPNDSGLYFTHIWAGLWASAHDVKGLNVELEQLVCRDEQHQYELLKQIADAGSEYAGVITFSYTRNPKVLLQLQRLLSQRVVTVLIDDELKEPEGLYCIPSNEKALGRVAGEFISLITPSSGTVLVSSGRPDSKIHVNKISSFIDYLAETKPDVQVHVVEGYSNRPETNELVYNAWCEALKQHPDITAIYALTSHDNAIIVRAVEAMEIAQSVSIIGTDLSESSARYLSQGKLKAVINQGAFMKGYQSLSILVDRAVKNIAPSQRIDCPIDIVLKSNLSFYERSNNINHGGKKNESGT